MSDFHTQYVVKNPVLWFMATGQTQPDAPVGFLERSYTVYRSVLAAPGDRFHLVDGVLVHEDGTGKLSTGLMRLHYSRDQMEVFEAMKLFVSGDLDVVGPAARPQTEVPEIPTALYPSNHPGVERDRVSPAFVSMMDSTEDFRHDCDEDGAWTVICSDYGMTRTVALTVSDVETGSPQLHVELDPLSGTATITAVDQDIRAGVVDGFRAAGITVDADGMVKAPAWSTENWSVLQDCLSNAFLGTRPVAAPLAMTA